MDEAKATKYVEELVKNAKAAQKAFERGYTDQRSVDEVIRAIGKAVYDRGDELAGEAVSETGMGDFEGKRRKLNSVALLQWNFMKGKKSVGVIDDTTFDGVNIVAKPLGVIGCVMPSTNPIATVIGNSMIALKCRNAVIISPHPASAHISSKVVDIMREGLKAIDAPVDLVQSVSPEYASIETTTQVLYQCDVNIGTGSAAMVKAVYSAGRPAFGVGQGNCQSVIDVDSPPMATIAQWIVFNRSNDVGVPCTGEQFVHVPESRVEEFLEVMQQTGAYVIRDRETIDKYRELVFPNNGPINRAVVGKTPHLLGKELGINIPEDTKVLLFNLQAKGTEDIFCKEILNPTIRYRIYTDFEEAVEAAIENLEFEGAGHSSAIWSNVQGHIDYAANLFPVGRLHINQGTGGGANGLPNSITIGCGSWGNNSISEYLQYYHLMNKTHVTTPLDKPTKRMEPEDWDIYE